MKVSEQIARLEAPLIDDRPFSIALLRTLPPDMEAPTISNIRPEPCEVHGVKAHLAFSGPSYDPEKRFNPVEVLAGMEGAGWALMPATLVRKDRYRRTEYLGRLEDIPERLGQYEVTDVSVICPLWVEPCMHMGPHVECFMRSPSGVLCKVRVRVPSLPVSVYARRIEGRGTWHYERGTAKLRYPDSWEALHAGDEPIAERHQHSGAWVDTDQGISGVIYWGPYTEQDEFPLSASEMLRVLMTPA